MTKLLQFPYSHFCEKARWALDYKHQPYTVQNLLPICHLFTARRLAPHRQLPILLIGDAVIQGSDRIIDWLDTHIAAYPLTPADQALARQAREWEQFAAQEIGIQLRRWFYAHILGDRRRLLHFLSQDATPAQRLALRCGMPLLRVAMRKAMAITPHNTQKSADRLCRALDRLDAAIAGSFYLTGDAFSRADLSTAALLSPLVAIGSSDEELTERLPAAVYAWRAREADRPAFRWVREQYRLHRRPSPEEDAPPTDLTDW
jgi:glutathione S-transferase